jgi:hypothetical protein
MVKLLRVKIQGLITRRSAWLLAVALISGSIAAWCWLVFGNGVESNDFKAATILLRVLIYSGIFIAAMLLLSPVSKLLRRVLRWLLSWRTIKRGLIGLAGLFIFVVLFYAEENWRGRHAWEKFKREWEAKGERFDFASFVPPPVPDDQNFALTPIVASCYSRVLDRQGHRIKPENTNLVNRLEMEIYRDGISASTNMPLGLWPQSRVTDLKAWQDHYRTTALTNELIVEASATKEAFARRYGLMLVATNVATNTIEARSLATNEFPIATQPQSPAADVLLALSKYDSAIEELRPASRLPYARFPLEYSANNPGDMVFPHYESLKATASVLRLRAIAELANRQPESALADIRLILYLADSVHHEPVRRSLRSRLEMVNYTIQPIWEGLAQRQWSDDQLAAMERELAGFDAMRDYGLVLRSDLAWHLKATDYLRVGHMTNSVICMCGNTMFWPTLAYRLAPSGWFYLNKVALARCYQAAFPTSTELNQRVLSPDISLRFEETAGQVRSQYSLLGNWFIGFYLPSLEREANTCARTQTSVDLARVACALERFRQASGGFPESLNALVPTYLSEIPHDVVNGQPLRCRRAEDDTFLLYSVGWNEADDGGEPEPSRYFYYGISKPTGDWVWRYPSH